MIPFNDLGRAAHAQSADLQRIMAEVVDSGWFVHGPHHQAFERELAEYLGVPHVLGLASGTDALEIALRAVATATRRTVVTVANAGAYTTCAAIAAGLQVRFSDVDPVTHTISAAALQNVLDDDVAAVVVTHLYGRLADVESVRRICDPLGIAVIEDCAQSLGARNTAGMGGSLGHLSTFSFYPTKNLGALGDGGAIATNDPDLRDRVHALRQYGWTGKYHNELAGGRNSRLDELQAAILAYRLTLLDTGNERRRAIIGRYASAAPQVVRVLPASGPDHVGHLAVVETEQVKQLRDHFTHGGIRTDVHYPTPDHQQPAFRADVELPVTERLAGQVLSLPCFPELTDDEVDRVATALSTFEPGAGA